MTQSSALCPNCNSQSALAVRNAVVTKSRIECSLVHCSHCDFLYLENPTWLSIAYEDEFYGDTGYVQRNIRIASFLRILFLVKESLQQGTGSIRACDLGTGIGMLPRLMRDYGFDYWGTDKYSKMQLIEPFVNPGFDIQVKTAFEVIEHIPSLPEFLSHEVSHPEVFIFSTELRQDYSVPNDNWWYYAFQTGQHISFHSQISISFAAEAAGFPPNSLISMGAGLYAFALTPAWMKALKITRRIHERWIAPLLMDVLGAICRKKSFTWDDHLTAMSKLGKNTP